MTPQFPINICDMKLSDVDNEYYLRTFENDGRPYIFYIKAVKSAQKELHYIFGTSPSNTECEKIFSTAIFMFCLFQYRIHKEKKIFVYL